MRKVIILIALPMLLILASCNGTNFEKKEAIDYENTNGSEDTIDNEITSDLSSKTLDEFQSSSSVPFKINLQISLNEKDKNNNKKIKFEIIVQEPKQKMKDVTITALLNESMYKYVSASHLWFSNVESVNDPSVPRPYFILSPNPTDKDTMGVVVSRTFILLDKEFDSNDETNLLEDIFKTKIKVSWEDDQSTPHTSYIVFNKEDVSVDLEALQ